VIGVDTNVLTLLAKAANDPLHIDDVVLCEMVRPAGDRECVAPDPRHGKFLIR